MSDTDEFAHRHLLSAEGLQEAAPVETLLVRIVIGAEWAGTRAGHLLASCLVNLLVRQVKLVREIAVTAPTNPRLVQMPYGDSSAEFPACLVPFGSWATNSAVSVTVQPNSRPADLTIFVGDCPASSDSSLGRALCVIGDGWRAWIGVPERAPHRVIPSSTNPLGPFLAAALTAGEVFKASRGIRRGRYLTSNGYSLWSESASPDWDTLTEGPSLAGAVLPPVHVAGVGAVGNALAYMTMYLELAQAYLVLIDDDHYDKTNLNRCLLAGWADRDEPKVQAVARALRTTGVGAFPFEGTVKSYLGDARLGLRADAAREANEIDFQIIASCVDKGISRQDVQGLWPRLLIGGSTVNLQAKRNVYNARQGAACLACFNPKEGDGEKIRSLKDKLLQLSTADRSEFLKDNGLNAKAVEEYLSGAPCGGLGEAALKDFATRIPPQFSAGFVSLGAGLLLGGALLRTTVSAETASRPSDMGTINFLNGGLLGTPFAADDACELQCQIHARARSR
jgi:ThiF family